MEQVVSEIDVFQNLDLKRFGFRKEEVICTKDNHEGKNYLYSQQAKKLGASAYFLQNQLNEGEKIMLLIFDLTEESVEIEQEDRIKELQQRVWSNEASPLLLFLFKNESILVNSSYLSDSSEINRIELSELGENLEHLAAQLKSGVLWENKLLKLSSKNAVNVVFTTIIEEFKERAESEGKLTEEAINGILEEALYEKVLNNTSTHAFFSRHPRWEKIDGTELSFDLIAYLFEYIHSEDKKKISRQLAQLLVDESLPFRLYKTIDLTQFKVLEPIVDSSQLVLLSFQRLFNLWQLQNPKEKISVDECKVLISNVSINSNNVVVKEAIKLGLTSILSKKFNFTLVEYNETLSAINWLDFDYFSPSEEHQVYYDLLLGNPLFLQGKTDRQNYSWIASRKSIELEGLDISMYYLAQAFWYLKPSAQAAFLVDSQDLLYRQASKEFHEELFIQQNVYKVYTLNTLAHNGQLWDSEETVPSIAAFVRNEKPDCCRSFLHQVLRNSRASREGILLESDDYDAYYINKQTEYSKKVIWKNDLLGGKQVRKIVEKLEALPIFSSVLGEKQAEITDFELNSVDFSQISGLSSELNQSLTEYSDVYRFYLFATDSELLLTDSAVFTKEMLMHLPFISKENNLTNLDKEIISEVLDYYAPLLSEKGEYQVFESLPKEEFSSQITAFSEAFLYDLNALYEIGDKKFRLHEALYLPNGYIATLFIYSEDAVEPVFTEGSSEFVNAKAQDINLLERLEEHKIVRLFPDRETIVFVKPDLRKYWLAMAGRDEGARYYM